MSSRRVAACVVTGFLGSGKTSLLRGLLERDPGRERIAVVVNEIGEIGIDGRVLTGFDYVENVVELASGCVCCSIDEYRFDLAVDELVRRLDPALLVIETTGVADPGPLLERMRRCGLGVDAVVTVVDATNWRVALRASRTARRQIAAADFLVISKGDLAGAGKVARLAATLKSMQPRALVLEGARDAAFAGAELLLATSAARVSGAADGQSGARGGVETERAGEAAAEKSAGGDPVAGPGRSRRREAGHLADDRMESFAWSCAVPVDRESFGRALADLPREVLRAKGFLRAPGERIAYLFQAVCGRVETSGFEGGATLGVGVQAVFVGSGILARKDEIVARLEACIVGGAAQDTEGEGGERALRPIPG
jgi:cobalamin biosynthesis protein CobW